MAPKKEKDEEQKVEVPLSELTKMQEQMAALEQKVADNEAKNAGLEEMFAKSADTTGEPKLREKKSFEPKFRTVRLRKYPVAGNVEDLDFIVGWTNRGAYQEVDRSGVSPQIVDYIEVIFLRNAEPTDGKIKAEKIKLLDLMNRGMQVHCKIIKMDRVEKQIPTGEEIDVTIFDPAHGLVSTGEKVDGFVTQSEIKCTIQIPGKDGVTVVDGLYVNN